MQVAARFHITAVAALAAGTMLAVTPATSSLPQVHAPAIRLAATDGISDLQTLLDDLLSFLSTGPGPVIVPGEPLQTLQADELLFNTYLTDADLTANAALVDGYLSTEESIAPLFSFLADSSSSDAILNGALDPLFNIESILASSKNVAEDVFLGANADPATVISSLLTTAGNPYDLFDSGEIGGIEGILDNGILSYFDATGFVNDQFGLTGASAVPGPSLAELATLQTDELNLGDQLGLSELAFNDNLTSSEVAAEAAAFGGQTEALNGLVDRFINADNELLASGENVSNFVLGAENVDPTTLTASLLIPSDTSVFDTGDIGGLEGAVDQLLAGISDAAGLTPADFATGAFDSAAFTAALSGAFDISAFDPVASDLSIVATDLSTIFTSLF